MNNVWVLAQGPGDEAPSTIPSEPITDGGEAMQKVPSDPNLVQQPAPRQTSYTYWLFIGLMFILMYLVLFKGPRKKQHEQRQMVQSLGKNDRVRTIGGIIGTVVDIKGDEITLKVDESNNTKIKVVSSAIGKNLSKDNK